MIPFPPTLAGLRDARVRADPYPLYRSMRETGPVQWDDSVHAWVLTSHRLVSLALRDSRLSSVRPRPAVALTAEQSAQMKPLLDLTHHMFVYRDGSYHRRLRRHVQSAFSPRTISRLEHILPDLVDQALVPVRDGAVTDIIGDVALPVTARVLAVLLGVPDEYVIGSSRWEHDLSRVLGAINPSPDHVTAAAADVIRYAELFQDLSRQRLAAPVNDLLSALLHSPQPDDALSDLELFATCQLLVMAGRVTTAHLIGNIVLRLLRHPDELALLSSRPERLASAVAELSRLESSAQYVARVAAIDLDIDGHLIKRGDRVLIVLAAANRDPVQHADPDRFDPDRMNPGDVVFGAGPHYCLGAGLAGMETRAVLSRLMHHFARLELAAEDLTWLETQSLRGVTKLPARLWRR
jgi:cytochrome P450